MKRHIRLFASMFLLKLFNLFAANYAVRSPHIWFYFTIWNTELISVFFVFAMTSSIIGFVYESSKDNDRRDSFDGEMKRREALNKKSHRIIWPSSIIAFGHVVHILFQVCGGMCTDTYAYIDIYTYKNIYI